MRSIEELIPQYVATGLFEYPKSLYQYSESDNVFQTTERRFDLYSRNSLSSSSFRMFSFSLALERRKYQFSTLRATELRNLNTRKAITSFNFGSWSFVFWRQLIKKKKYLYFSRKFKNTVTNQFWVYFKISRVIMNSSWAT